MLLKIEFLKSFTSKHPYILGDKRQSVFEVFFKERDNLFVSLEAFKDSERHKEGHNETPVFNVRQSNHHKLSSGPYM